jgi:hypothetical protein
MQTRLSVTLVFLTVLSFGLMAAGAAQARESFRASAVAIEPVPGPQTGFLTIQFDGATPADRLAEDVATFRKDGQQALLTRWYKEQPVVGRLLFPEELGIDVRVAIETKTAQGRHLVLITDRPITLGEVRRNDRSRDYPITWIELDLDAQGNGSGRMIPVAKLKLQGDAFAFENFNIQPVRLNNVKKIDE